MSKRKTVAEELEMEHQVQMFSGIRGDAFRVHYRVGVQHAHVNNGRWFFGPWMKTAWATDDNQVSANERMVELIAVHLNAECKKESAIQE